MLTNIGCAVKRGLLSLRERYPFITIEKYVIMPNHVHAIVIFHGEAAAGASARPTLADIMRAFKSTASHAAGRPIWQTSFHDHVIRNENDFLSHWQYIEENPGKWMGDEYFTQ